MRGATKGELKKMFTYAISIHAPHAGRDFISSGQSKELKYFNPRAPCGARHEVKKQWLSFGNISIHAPHAGRDRKAAYKKLNQPQISIHAPHAGRDTLAPL